MEGTFHAKEFGTVNIHIRSKIIFLYEFISLFLSSLAPFTGAAQWALGRAFAAIMNSKIHYELHRLSLTPIGCQGGFGLRFPRENFLYGRAIPLFLSSLSPLVGPRSNMRDRNEFKIPLRTASPFANSYGFQGRPDLYLEAEFSARREFSIPIPFPEGAQIF